MFGFKKGSKKEKFKITEPDREWVEENMEWLIHVFGYPDPQSRQFLLTDAFFPKTFGSETITIPNIIQDLKTLLQISGAEIAYEIVEDIRDAHGVPHWIEGNPFETELKISESGFKVLVAKSLQEHPRRLISNLVFEFLKIKLFENKLEFDQGYDTDLFLYLAGVYFGFGIIISQDLRETGRSYDGFWETKWNYFSEMPDEVMAFALALQSKLIGEDASVHRDQLPTHIKKQVDLAQDYLKDHPGRLATKEEVLANQLFMQADLLYQERKIKEAISTIENALSLTRNDLLKVNIYNNLGYYFLRLGEYKKSIAYLRSSLLIDPNFGFTNDNLGYALIQLGELEEGKIFVENAIQSGSNDMAYSFRNLALYYQAKGETVSAEEYFLKAFEAAAFPVDLLEYHFGNFLTEQGKTEEGLRYLEMAVEKGEPEAISRAKD